MRIERIWELEEKEFTDKLFKNAAFKGGGGSGGGGTSTQTVEKADPWEGQQPFLKDVFAKAQSRYNDPNSPSFFPNSTVENFNPLETSYQNSVVDYAQGGRPQALQAGAEGAINNELFNPSNNAMYQATRGLAPYAQSGLNRASGFTGQQALDDTNASPIMKQMLSGSVQQNPFIQGAVNSFADDSIANFQNKVMPALRSSQIGAGQIGGGTRGEIAAGLAGSGLARSIADYSNKAYMDAFNSAQNQQMQAANLMEQGQNQRANQALAQGMGAFGQGLAGENQIQGGFATGLNAYGGVSQSPIENLGNISDIGMSQRELAQQMLDEQVNRHSFDSNIEDQRLSNYANLVQGNYGSNNVTSQSRGGTSLAGNLSQGAGAIAGLAGLLS